MTERERDRERGWGNGEGKGWRGENKRPFKDQNTPRWRALVFEWRDVQEGERVEGSSRHENASHMGCVFVPSRTG